MFNAIHAAQNKQNFLFGNAEVDTDGNPLAHVIYVVRQTVRENEPSTTTITSSKRLRLMTNGS